ncbi:putative TIR domain-containing protein [Medicago truncatula]|uniref:Putative TIR domain-containing protein n=1 Tax=Medicago truncatula TaxID=3880 RepID=A0A396I0C2_MEDTR|nr:putative TIR domain-containing protein [Medicago truncatula]
MFFINPNPSMSSFTTDSKRKSYIVYFSFCDKDAASFVSHLYTALRSEDGIVVFWVDYEMRGNGEIPIPISMLKVIEHCQVAIIVFWVNSVFHPCNICYFRFSSL